jgi:hypothetical protein
LEERRERRKLNDAAAKSEQPGPAKEVAPAELAKGPAPAEQQEFKQELLTSKVDELLWQAHQMEIQHLVKLMETYSRNYHLASEQYARWGDALVPPIIVHNMQEAENALVETIKKLEMVLAKVYKKDITIIE